jgi:hypothetical protein
LAIVLQDATAEFDVSIQQLKPVILGFFSSAEYFDRKQQWGQQVLENGGFSGHNLELATTSQDPGNPGKTGDKKG